MNEKRVTAVRLMAAEIDSLRRRQAEITEKARVDTEALNKEIERARRIVLRGKWTIGDRITDFFFGAYGILDDAEISKPFRELEVQMAGKTGELFLIVRRERDRHVFRDGRDQSSRESDYHLTTCYTLGILSDDKLVLNLKEGDHGLPTEAYVDVEMYGRLAEKRPGPFMFTAFHGLHELGKMISGGHDSGAALEIFVGDEAVFTYSPPEFLVAKPRKRPAHWVIALNSAIRLLGRDIPEAPEEKDARREKEESLYKP